jgi:hypothetical protein
MTYLRVSLVCALRCYKSNVAGVGQACKQRKFVCCGWKHLKFTLRCSTFSFAVKRPAAGGGTAALRLIVQPCDEDEEKADHFFPLFRVMEHRWNDIDRGKQTYSGKSLSQCHFVHHKSHMD